ncbi:hypothetical protein JW916_12460 [Candidatus Sumerlaeota bacterium]|nr:hypothetical protein [Candidatus Sumerlaeota bacterium]
MSEADREILDHFNTVRSSTVELTRRIPDDWLERLPEREMYRPLRWLLLHAAGAEG